MVGQARGHLVASPAKDAQDAGAKGCRMQNGMEVKSAPQVAVRSCVCEAVCAKVCVCVSVQWHGIRA